MTKLYDLEHHNNFATRHIGPSDDDIQSMLGFLGVASLDALTDQIVPQSIKNDTLPDLDKGHTENEALNLLRTIAQKNKNYRSLIGLGYYDTITPSVILRNVLENPGWYTAYTPYQPEISQGRLEALLNFQQMVIDLTAMEIANASMLDEATAAAEAMTMAMRVNRKNKSVRFLVADDCHPQTRAVLETRAAPLNIELITFSPENGLPQGDAFGLLLQYPNTYGRIEDLEKLVQQAHDQNTLVAVATDLLALALLKAPGEFGADIVIGSAQRFGVPMGYGGPHAAFFATRDAYKRSVPGRIVGVSVDQDGKTALRLALQTREQHIRRDKATSNICTAQVLLANIAGLYAAWHGPEGLKNIAARAHRFAAILSAGLTQLGFTTRHQHFFDTLVIETNEKTQDILKIAKQADFNFRKIDDQTLGLSLDQKTNRDEIEKLWDIFALHEKHNLSIDLIDQNLEDTVPKVLLRKSTYLEHPVFHQYHSETEMMRYLRQLEHKDISLNRSMIPLGSCTMKLNAASEMTPITWPEFTDIHPFVPLDQAQGYQQMINELEEMLCKLTGFSAVSLQPNAGSQGEYSGLLVIKAYHNARGDTTRDICLIPSSAHGTNPASAVMAGMKVVVVKCDDNGNIDVKDLHEKAEKYKQNLAALMVTYPSTHGVFEEAIRDICDTIHQYGGQVYMDGANLNAMLGIAYPGSFGADVMHMNLHKTFCIPHGGGGPGVGPIGVGEHLAPYLPGNPLVNEAGGQHALSAISAAPWGSALILPITWMYIKMMGAEGLKKATQVAILSANYLSKKLEPYYQTLYKGQNNFVAHECILDTRSFQKTANVSVDDLAKRLMDFGFHAPTMSFPVVHTLMVEPTESESKAELDRFIEAMATIRQEIKNLEKGKWVDQDNPLHQAPHSLAVITNDQWSRSYPRHLGAFPMAHLHEDKYWPPVSRIDNAAGDRNFMCTCPPIELYDEAAE